MCNTIFLVDDDSSLLSSLSLYLSSHGFIVKSFNDVNSALKFLEIQQPDLIISDIVMPQEDGYKLLHFLQSTSEYKEIPLIFLTAKGMTPDRILGYNLGCHGYLIKPFDPEELLAIIHNILSRIQSHVIDDITIQNSTKSSSNHLNQRLMRFTFREQTVLQFVLQGMTNKEIALKLSLSLRNIEKYVSRLLSKTCTRNRTELTQYCYNHNIDFLEGE